MLKCFWTLIVIASFISSSGISGFAAARSQGLTESEKREAQEIAVRFSTRFLETTDLHPLIKELFVRDFAERYRSHTAKSLAPDREPDLYFVPGLDYNARLLTEANAKDWQRFYIATKTFLFFGVMNGIRNSTGSGGSFKSTDFYPSSVIKLLNSNPNLANMIVRQGNSKAVSSVDEMHKATATLETAASMMRDDQKGKSLPSLNRKELIKVMDEDELFKPRLQVSDSEYFGFPQGTRIIFINTPLLFRLTLVRTDEGLRILWADPFVVN